MKVTQSLEQIADDKQKEEQKKRVLLFLKCAVLTKDIETAEGRAPVSLFQCFIFLSVSILPHSTTAP